MSRPPNPTAALAPDRARYLDEARCHPRSAVSGRGLQRRLRTAVQAEHVPPAVVIAHRTPARRYGNRGRRGHNAEERALPALLREDESHGLRYVPRTIPLQAAPLRFRVCPRRRPPGSRCRDFGPNLSLFRPRTKTYGSVPPRMAICRRLAGDARGRKQYRYHPAWRAVRDATKFERMTVFGQTLPRIGPRENARRASDDQDQPNSESSAT